MTHNFYETKNDVVDENDPTDQEVVWSSDWNNLITYTTGKQQAVIISESEPSEVSLPDTAATPRLWYKASTGEFKLWNGSAWVQFNSGVTDHGALTGLSDDDHPQYINHSLATAENDVLVASGVGAFVKKTLTELKTILGLGSAAYTASTDYAVAAKGVTNGDSHDHSGGDGAQISHAGLSNITATDHHSNANDPTANEKAALAGTSGTAPSGTNKLVDNADTRLSDARTPSAHTHAAGEVTSGSLDGDRLAAPTTTKRGGVKETGTVTGTKYYRDDDTWATPPGGGSVATDAIWDAAGDLAVGSGADTAVRLPKGSALQLFHMKSDASNVEWVSQLLLAAGSASAGTAPIKLTAGTLNTTPEAGTIEFDGSDFYISV